MTAKEKNIIKSLKSIFNTKMKNLSYNDKVKLFDELENWIISSMEGKQKELTLIALYDAESVQDIIILKAVNNALKNIK